MKFGENQNVEDILEYSNNDMMFASKIINNIKRAQRLPLAINSEDVFNAIRNETPWWYEHRTEATTEQQLAFNLNMFQKQKEYFERKGFQLFGDTILMPSGVMGVYSAYYDSNYIGNRPGITLAKWQLESILINTLHVQSQQYGVDNYLVAGFCSNLLWSLSREPVAYEYSPLTKEFKVFDKGNRVGSIYCKVALAQPLSALYNDLWYSKYIMAHVINARCDQIELYGAQLPGDTQVNISVLRNRADKLLDEVKAYIEADESADFYIEKS